jgi:hypothetical protein
MALPATTLTWILPDMSLNILRWKGGFGGDMLMRLISDSCTVSTNLKFNSHLSQQGAVSLSLDHLDPENLRQIDCISNGEFMSKIDNTLLKQELDDLAASDVVW